MPFVAAETAALAERTLGHLDPARVAADPAAASDAARLVELAARDASVRAAVATDPRGFVPALAAALRAAADEEVKNLDAADASLHPSRPSAFAPVARALRNVCAGEPGACAEAVARGVPAALADAAAALADALERDASSKVSAPSSPPPPGSGNSGGSGDPLPVRLKVALQCAANLAAGGGDPAVAEAVREATFPRAAAAVARLRGAAAGETHPPLCALARALVKAECEEDDARSSLSRRGGEKNVPPTNGERTADVLLPTPLEGVFGFEACASVWRPMLAAAADDGEPDGAGGGAWLSELVRASCVCVGGGPKRRCPGALPALCRGVAPDAAEVAKRRDERLRAKLMDVVMGREAGDGGEEGEEEEEDREEGGERKGILGAGKRKKKWTEISASSDGLREKFSREQATLLALAREAAEATPEANASDGSGSFEDPGGPRLVFPEATLAYVLDLTSRAAAAVAREAEEASAEDVRTTFEPTFEPNAPDPRATSAPDPRATSAPDPRATTPSLPPGAVARAVLESALALLRSLTEREVPPALMRTDRDIVQTLCAMGMPRLLLALTASLPPPRGAGRTSDAAGPSAAPALDPAVAAPAALREGHPPYPRARPWPGYRVATLAPLANAMFGRPSVCDQTFELGGVAMILAATRGEDGDEYLREYALWATRNVCAGSDEARAEIEAMHPKEAADSQALAAKGIGVRVDPETGKVRVGPVARGGDAGSTTGGGGEEGMNDGANGTNGAAGEGGASASGPSAAKASARVKQHRLILSGGGDRARTPAGRAVQAALEAGLEPNAEGEDEEAFEPPSNWKVADLS